MKRASWLDEQSSLPVLDDSARKLESFISAMGDGIIEKNELEAQQARLVAAMKAVEPELSDAVHEKVTRVLVELTAYNIMRLLHELQIERARRAVQA